LGNHRIATGESKARAKLFAGVDPRVISAGTVVVSERKTRSWWDESNINLLTDNAYENCDPAMGATPVRTLLVNFPRRKRRLS
jgi:hypothetical protein